MNFTAEEVEILRHWNDELRQSITVNLVRSRDERSEAFKVYLDSLGKLAPKIRIAPEDGEDGEPPAIVVERSLRFNALPQAGELKPFLELLSMVDTREAGVPDSVRTRIEKIPWPASLKIYVTPQCPFCPGVLSRLIPVSFINKALLLRVIDGALFPEMAAQDSVRSVPTVILDDQFRWTGALKSEEVLDALEHRDPSRLSARSIKDILKEGHASRIARMMLDSGSIFPAFIDILAYPDWSVRLGAMVVMEEIADENPELAKEALQPLWDRLEAARDSIKGDILYLTGTLGDETWTSRLETLLETEESPEVREAIREAILTLKEG